MEQGGGLWLRQCVGNSPDKAAIRSNAFQSSSPDSPRRVTTTSHWHARCALTGPSRQHMCWYMPDMLSGGAHVHQHECQRRTPRHTQPPSRARPEKRRRRRCALIASPWPKSAENASPIETMMHARSHRKPIEASARPRKSSATGRQNNSCRTQQIAPAADPGTDFHPPLLHISIWTSEGKPRCN